MICAPVFYQPALESIARAEYGRILVSDQFFVASAGQQVAILLHEEGHIVDMAVEPASSPEREIWAWEYAAEMILFFAASDPDPMWIEAYLYACNLIESDKRWQAWLAANA